jgi:hypothetical protein
MICILVLAVPTAKRHVAFLDRMATVTHESLTQVNAVLELKNKKGDTFI